jgi:hypothetical protein
MAMSPESNDSSTLSYAEPVQPVRLNPSRICRALAVIAFVLLLADIALQLSKFLLGHDSLRGLVRLFDLDDERNVPTFFSALLMIIAASLLAIIARLSAQQKSRDASKWIILSLGFLYISYDDAFMLHEKLNAPLRALLGPDLGFFYHTWVIPGIALVLALGLFFGRFLMNLPGATRLRFLLAATVYLVGAIGFEMIGGNYRESHGVDNLAYKLIASVEEVLEMTGLILFIHALQTFIGRSFREVRFRFE